MFGDTYKENHISAENDVVKETVVFWKLTNEYLCYVFCVDTLTISFLIINK